MAYFDENDDEQLDPNAPQEVQTGPQAATISGQGATSSGSATSAPAQTPNAPDKPGNFVGIQQYLAQNKPQSANLAKDVGSYVTGQGEAAKTALNEGQGSFNQAVDQSTVQLNNDLFEEAKKSPQQVAQDQAKKAEFQKMRDAQYSGPSSLESSDYYQPINSAIQNALGTAQKTTSAEGRSSLLADIQRANKQKVSRGAANLDAALLSTSPDSREILSQAKESIAPIQGELESFKSAADLKAAQGADQTAKTQKAIRDAFSGSTGVQGQLESDLRNKAAGSISAADKAASDVIAKLKAGDANVSDAQLKLLGIGREQYNGLLNDQKYYKNLQQGSGLEDLSSFATAQNAGNQISAQNVASADDYARYQALNDLMGTSNVFLSDPTNAGKANLDTLDFNFDATPNALADRINNISYNNMRGSQSTFADSAAGKGLNSRFNFNLDPLGPSNIAKSISASREGKRAHDFDEVVSSLQDGLRSINDAYGTNLQLPASYREAATKLANEHIGYNDIPGPIKEIRTNPTESEINQAGYISALITFLNDLSKDPSKVRTNPAAWKTNNNAGLPAGKVARGGPLLVS